MKKSAFILMLTASLMLTGCGENETAENASSETSAAMSESEDTSMQQIEESEEIVNEYPDFDDINKITIGDKTVSLPFKIEELGEGYSIIDEGGFDDTYQALYYNEQFVAIPTLNTDGYVCSIAFDSYSIIKDDINIYGISFNDNFDRIINALGEPTRKKELALIYEYDNGELYFGSEDGSLDFNYVKLSLIGDFEDDTSVQQIESQEDINEYPDFDDINKITIGDKTVSLPFKAEELGEEFYVDNYVGENGNVHSDLCLYYSDKPYAFVEVSDNNSIISFYPINTDDSNWKIYLFDKDVTSDFVKTSLGEPYYYSDGYNNDNEYCETLFYKYGESSFIIFLRDNRVESIMLDLYN